MKWKGSRCSNPSGCVEVGIDSETGMVHVRDTNDPETVVKVTPTDWYNFILDVKDGHHDDIYNSKTVGGKV